MKSSPVKKIPAGRVAFIIFLLMAALGTMFFLNKCSRENHAPFERREGHSGGDTIDVAIEVSPIMYSLASDTVSGLDYDMVRRMAASWSRPVKFHPFAPLEYALNGLESGRFDIVVSSLPSTTGMKERFSMSEPVYIDRQVLVQHLESPDSLPPIRTQTDLAGDTVWISKGSPYSGRIRSLAHEIGDTIFIETSDSHSAEHLFLLVAVGELPRAVVSSAVAAKMAPDYPTADISTPISFSQFQSWASAKERSGLADSINSWLSEFRLTEEYSELCKKYLE